MTDQWAYWRAELAKPSGTEQRQNRDTNISGYWRMVGAKTKIDYPVAIWRADGLEATIFQIGRQRPQNSVEHSKEWHDFLSAGWLWCKAVTKPEWDSAQAAGFWGDGKPARKMTDAERAGIDIKPGDNQAPVEEALADQINTLVEKAKAFAEPTTQDEANAATEVVDRLRKLWKLADEQRIVEKRPHDEAAKAVQAKWLTLLEPAAAAGAELDGKRKAYLRKEQARLDAIAAEERRKREEAARLVAEEERKRLQAIADAKAAAHGAVAEKIGAAEIAVAPVEAERAVAGSQFGRATGLKRARVAVVDDPLMLATHFISVEDTDFADYLRRRAAAALRGKVVLPGCSSREELQ